MTPGQKTSRNKRAFLIVSAFIFGSITSILFIFIFSSNLSWRQDTYEVESAGAFRELEKEGAFLNPGLKINLHFRKNLNRAGEGAFTEYATIGNLDLIKIQFLCWLKLRRESGLSCLSPKAEHIMYE